jgi:chemotaxis protein MotB
MDEAKNPFVKVAEKPGGANSASKPAWIVAAIMVVIAIVAIALLAWSFRNNQALESVHSDLNDANGSLTNALATVQHDKDQIAGLQSRLADLEKEKDTARQNAKKLEDEMRSDLESKDVTISKLQGKLTVNILDRVMFDSGDAVVKGDGESVLRKIAAILAEHPDLKIHVIGHTDNVPIRTRYASNWELSTARALAAVHFLTEKAGVAPSRVGAVGYGEFRPIADNSTPEGRAKNRRIAVTILSDELVGADAPPTEQTNSPSPTEMPTASPDLPEK